MAMRGSEGPMGLTGVPGLEGPRGPDGQKGEQGEVGEPVRKYPFLQNPTQVLPFRGRKVHEVLQVVQAVKVEEVALV